MSSKQQQKPQKPVIQQSQKPVKKLEEIVVPFIVHFPKEAANGVDPSTGKKAVMLKINSVKTYIPVDEDTEISKQQWSLLKNINFKWLPDFTNDPLKD